MISIASCRYEYSSSSNIVKTVDDVDKRLTHLYLSLETETEDAKSHWVLFMGYFLNNNSILLLSFVVFLTW